MHVGRTQRGRPAIPRHVTHESRTDGRLGGKDRQAGSRRGKYGPRPSPKSRERGWLFGGRAWLRDESLSL